MVEQRWVQNIWSLKLSGVSFCGVVYLSGIYGGLWSRVVSDGVVCTVDYG
jgi:hypothetical protein